MNGESSHPNIHKVTSPSQQVTHFTSNFTQQMNAHFMKKLPKDAEASNILVGELNALDKPLSAFIRLSEAVSLGDLTEVPVPTRFIFILLGPSVRSQQIVPQGKPMI